MVFSGFLFVLFLLFLVCVFLALVWLNLNSPWTQRLPWVAAQSPMLSNARIMAGLKGYIASIWNATYTGFVLKI